MALAKFSIIVTVDSNNGIAKDGVVPWNNRESSKFFRETTMGKRKNVVIMGRQTYEAIPEEHRPLEGRRCVVISSTWKPDISVYPSLTDALAGVGSSVNSYDEVFIIGGALVFREAVKKFMYLCKRIYITKLKTDYNCDQHFPFDYIKDFKQQNEPLKTRDYSRFTYLPEVYHDEYEYLKLLEDIKNDGEQRIDRTNVGTKSIFGAKMTFDLRDHIPIITTKRINYDAIIKELLFFISGCTDAKILNTQGVTSWDNVTSKKLLEEHKLPWDEGDMGPSYGHQWRHFGENYEGSDKTYKGIDQLKNLIKSIRDDPFSRRHILTAWNPIQTGETVIPPCHILAQFNVSNDKKYIDCQVYQRSGDMFLGVPCNITSYALLTYMIGHITALKPRKLIYIIGDAHIYNNHGEQVRKQLTRTPRPYPVLSFREATRLHEIDDFKFNNFIIEAYTSWAAITADSAI
jgi:dihydrofolate reductase / thymidylate synthase